MNNICVVNCISIILIHTSVVKYMYLGLGSKFSNFLATKLSDRACCRYIMLQCMYDLCD